MGRNIINISLPPEMASQVKKEVATGRYASVSEFFRDLLRRYQEDKILKDVRASRREIKQGKGKILHSLADLD